MRILIVLLFIAMIAFASRAPTEEYSCPDKDVMVFVPSPWGLLDIKIVKGLLDKENEDEYYVDSEKYDRIMEEELIEEEEEAQSI